MKKLRIHKMPYVNQGTANIELKGVTEYHAIFKFDTDDEAADFIRKVKEWHNATEKVGDKIKKALKDDNVANILEEVAQSQSGINSTKAGEALAKTLKDEVKKPIPKKRKAGRPAKADIQG